jgi:hypothetical protein
MRTPRSANRRGTRAISRSRPTATGPERRKSDPCCFRESPQTPVATVCRRRPPLGRCRVKGPPGTPLRSRPFGLLSPRDRSPPDSLPAHRPSVGMQVLDRRQLPFASPNPDEFLDAQSRFRQACAFLGEDRNAISSCHERTTRHTIARLVRFTRDRLSTDGVRGKQLEIATLHIPRDGIRLRPASDVLVGAVVASRMPRHRGPHGGKSKLTLRSST